MEASFIAYLKGRVRALDGGRGDDRIEAGIGDDAAVLAPTGRWVTCVDQIIDGVDFRSDEHSPADIGFKAVAVNVSDVLAMGASPRTMLVTAAFPAADAVTIAGGVYDGIFEAAERFGVRLIGGDTTTYDGPLSLSVTLNGDFADFPAAEPWTRRGARVGDAVFVTGPVGGSILGRHLRPDPPVELVRRLRDDGVGVTAAIDVSDGLSLDLDRLCAASGVGVVIDRDAVPIHDDARARSQQTGETAFRHAWSDGEDFELILAVAPEDARRVSDLSDGRARRLATTTARTGLWTDEGGRLIRLSPQGYVHDAGADGTPTGGGRPVPETGQDR